MLLFHPFSTITPISHFQYPSWAKCNTHLLSLAIGYKAIEPHWPGLKLITVVVQYIINTEGQVTKVDEKAVWDFEEVFYDPDSRLVYEANPIVLIPANCLHHFPNPLTQHVRQPSLVVWNTIDTAPWSMNLRLMGSKEMQSTFVTQDL